VPLAAAGTSDDCDIANAAWGADATICDWARQARLLR
jgi:hypothetical protein